MTPAEINKMVAFCRDHHIPIRSRMVNLLRQHHLLTPRRKNEVDGWLKYHILPRIEDAMSADRKLERTLAEFGKRWELRSLDNRKTIILPEPRGQRLWDYFKGGTF